MVDEPGAIPMWVPDNIMFNSTDATWLCIHKTAGFQTAQDVAAYFQAGSNGENVSSHYVVGLDGTIVQCVPESRGAGANCCTIGAYASYLPYCDGRNDNMNLHTISIEHVDPADDNSTPVPDAQKAASFRLIHDICQRHNIPMRAGDASGGIIGHRDIDPVNRARCPGNYPWQELWDYLNNGGEHVGIPNGWTYDATNKVLKAPNGFEVRDGFGQHVLNTPWDPANWPLENEGWSDPLEVGNPSLGAGSHQRFRWITLGFTSARGVYVMWTGQELIALSKLISQLQAQLQSTQNTNIEQLQAQLDTANKQLSIAKSALAQIATEAATASK